MAIVNEVFSGQVRDLATDGRGVVLHPSGRAVFVDGVWVDEVGEFRITEIKGRSAFAEIVALTETSPQRVSPVCSHHGFGANTCGGCPWQFMDYAAQLQAKQQRVENGLKRLNIGNRVQNIWPSPRTEGYRNRAQFKTDGKKLGFLAAHSRQITEVIDCPILSDKNRHTLADMRKTLPNTAWRTP